MHKSLATFLIICIVVVSTVFAADKKFYEFPDIGGVRNDARFLVFDSLSGSRNITGANLKAAIGVGSGHTIQNSNVSLPARTFLNFSGAVQATDSGGKTRVTVRPATTSVDGTMSALDKTKVGYLGATSTNLEPYLLTSQSSITGGDQVTLQSGSNGSPIASEHATMYVEKYSSTDDGVTLWSKQDQGAGMFKVIKKSGTAHIIGLTGACIRTGGSNNCIGTSGFAETSVGPSGDGTGGNVYGMWGGGISYADGSAGGHLTGGELDVWDLAPGGDAGHYNVLGTLTNKTMSTGLWLNNMSNFDSTAALGITFGNDGTPSRWHTGILVDSDSITATDGSGNNEAVYVQGGSISGNAYTMLRGDGYLKHGLDLSGATLTGNAINLAAGQAVSTNTVGLASTDANTLNLGAALSISTTDKSLVNIQKTITPTAAIGGAVYGLTSVPVIGTSTYNVSSVVGVTGKVNTAAGYSGTLTETIDLYAINPVKSGGTITTAYGVKVDNITSGTNNYSIYTGSAPSVFNGPVTATSFSGDGSALTSVPSTLSRASTNGATFYPFLDSGSGNTVYTDATHVLYWDGTNKTLGTTNMAATGFTTVGSVSNRLGDIQVATTSTSATRGLAISQHSNGTQGAFVSAYKSRGTESSPSATSSGDYLLVLDGDAYVGPTNAYKQGARMGMITTSTPSDAAYGPAADIFFSTASGASAIAEHFRITSTGHYIATGTAPTLSSCGTSPSISGNDMAGKFTIGATGTGCTVTFANTYTNAPACVVTGGAAVTDTTSTTALTVTAVPGTYSYVCMGI